jgi:NAD+ synthase
MENNLFIDTGLVRKILTEFIRSEITRAGFSRAVVNLSGGIDSAVSFALAVEALGPQNVLALRLPYKTSSADSLEHAQLLIDQFGCPSVTIPITEMVDPLIERTSEMSDMRKGNILARTRMLIACALNPLGDLYQTQVRQLAPALDIPEFIIAKPPSADLWTGQTDEVELGFTYVEVDKLLYLLVDQRYRPEECVEAGFGDKFVRQVVERVRRSQFKRILPPIAKLSNRTAGYDFLYLRDWGT